jgi:hypothetical protein
MPLENLVAGHLGRGEGPAHAGGDEHADDLVACDDGRLEGVDDLGDAGLGRRRELARLLHAAVEGLRVDLELPLSDAAERGAERDDLERQSRRHVRGYVAGAVGDDTDRHVVSSAPSCRTRVRGNEALMRAGEVTRRRYARRLS